MAKRKGSQLRSAILASLARGELKLGDRLPTEIELIQKYGISRATVREGLASLVEDGILNRRPGAGTFIASTGTTNQSKIVAAMIPCVRNVEDVFYQMVRPIEDALHERGFSLILCNHDQNFDKIGRYVFRFCQERVAGIIFAPILLPGSLNQNMAALREFERAGIPFVLIDSAVSAETLPCHTLVSSNGFMAMRELVRHLAGLGHRRMAYISGLPEVFSTEQRRLGFLEEMRVQGLDVPKEHLKQIQLGPISNQGRQEIRELLSVRPAPTAVLCPHDFIARNVVEEVQKMGLRVPDDLAVVGFDDIPMAAHMDPPLTTTRQPTDAEGRLAVELLFEKMTGKFSGERQEFLPCRLIVRRSCGATQDQSMDKSEKGRQKCPAI